MANSSPTPQVPKWLFSVVDQPGFSVQDGAPKPVQQPAQKVDEGFKFNAKPFLRGDVDLRGIEEESVDPMDFEADPEEDRQEARATAAFEAGRKKGDNVFQEPIPTSPNISNRSRAGSALVRSEDSESSALSDDEDISVVRKLAKVDRRLRKRKSAAKLLEVTKDRLKAQDDLIHDLAKELQDARDLRSVMQAEYNYAKAHDRSNVEKQRVMRANSHKSLKVNLKQTVQEVKLTHIDGICDGIKYNNQKCPRFSIGWCIDGVDRWDYCAEHQQQVRYPEQD